MRQRKRPEEPKLYRLALQLEATGKVLALGDFVGANEGERIAAAANKYDPEVVILCPGDPMLRDGARPDPEPLIPINAHLARRLAAKASLATRQMDVHLVIDDVGKIRYAGFEEYQAQAHLSGMVSPAQLVKGTATIVYEIPMKKAGVVLEHATGC